IIALAGCLLLILLIALELTNTINLFQRNPQSETSSIIPSSSSNSKNSVKLDEQQSEDVGQPESSANSDKNTSAPVSGSELIEPSGNFVSTHHITLNDPIFNNLESICITSPNASCSITFKKDGITRTLESKAANNEGV